MSCRLCAVLVLIFLTGSPTYTSALQGSTVYATGNPHVDNTVCSGKKHGETSLCTSRTSIDIINVIREPKITQQDTLQRIVEVLYMGSPVPIYYFKQPTRLSEAELPFKLVLMRTIGTFDGFEVVQTPESINAYDSWFPGYRWDCIVCKSCDGYTHMGWQFSNGREIFYAFIVDYIITEEQGTRNIMENLKLGVKAGPAILSLMAMGIQK
eukprot:m.64691 g.64691  ORF g.64691 m.64691 type:complete len:210 (-) comp15893_c0_seq13:1741-2370(-)